MISFKSFQDKIAIVVVGYNRIDSISRLLSSLLKAHYSVDVPLIISIDASGNKELYSYVNNFSWPFGEKYVNIEKERLGLKKHILQCGDLTEFFKGIILLEDDLYVSPSYYEYAIKAVEYYGKEDRIAGISLHCNEMMGSAGIPMIHYNNGSSAFLRQATATWGECWTTEMWKKFKEWFNKNERKSFTDYRIPSFMKAWDKAWSKFYCAYLVETDRYFLFPYISLTTNFSEAGENGKHSSSLGQVNLLMGPVTYHFLPFNQLIKYDIFGVNSLIYDRLYLNASELCVNFWGFTPYEGQKFILSPLHYPLPIVKSFALSLRPIELNIIEGISGAGLYLYEVNTEKEIEEKGAKAYPLSMAYYYLRNFNFRLLFRYVICEIFNKIKQRIKG